MPFHTVYAEFLSAATIHNGVLKNVTKNSEVYHIIFTIYSLTSIPLDDIMTEIEGNILSYTFV